MKEEEEEEVGKNVESNVSSEAPPTRGGRRGSVKKAVKGDVEVISRLRSLRRGVEILMVEGEREKMVMVESQKTKRSEPAATQLPSPTPSPRVWEDRGEIAGRSTGP